MIGAGDLDRLVEVERIVEGAVDDYNVPLQVWQVFCRAWAKRVDVRDAEREAAGQLAGAAAARFTIWSSIDARTITTADRLRHEDRIWEIVGVKESAAGATGEFLEITAQVSSDPDELTR